MREPTEIISNISALLVICVASALVLSLPASPEQKPTAGPGSVELSLEAAAPEVPPEPPKPEPAVEPPAPVAEPTPPPPEPETPPPQPETAEEPPKPDEEPPKPVEMLMDEDGEKSKLRQPALVAVSEEVKSKFQSCLRKYMVGLTAKESKKAGQRGPVRVTLSYDDNKLLALEIVQGSGSPLVDQRARTNALNSDCGKVVKTGSVSIEMNY